MVAAYRYRPPYPAAVFALLASLLRDEPCAVLDVGCGRGDIARPLLPFVERVDAVDLSAAMIEEGQKLPGGARPALRWLHGSAEDVALAPPYALITAGSSIHWLDWERVFARFRAMLTPGGSLAIVELSARPAWWDRGLEVIRACSTNREFQPYNVIEELQKRRLFDLRDEQSTAPVPFVQPIEEYIESFHSRNGLSRERMSAQDARAFDDEMRAVLRPFARDGQMEMQISGVVSWGKPLAPSSGERKVADGEEEPV